MAIFLPTRKEGRGRQRPGVKRLTGAESTDVAVVSDPGIRVPAGAFGEQVGAALEGVGGALTKISKEQAIVAKANNKAEDASTLAQGKIAVDELIRKDQNSVRTTGLKDEDGEEVDQFKRAREDFSSFKNNVLDKRFIGKFKDPAEAAKLNNYFLKQSSIHEDFIEDDRFVKRDNENEATVSKMVEDLKNFKVRNPGIGDSPSLKTEFNDQVKVIEGLQRARLQAGMLTPTKFQNWQVNTADALGQIEVDQEISKIQNLGDPTGAQDLIDDLGEGKFKLKPETVQAEINKVFDEFSKFFDRKQKADAKLQKQNQDIVVSDAMRRSEDFGLEPGEERFGEEEFIRITSPRKVTSIVDGEVVTKTLPPLVTNPVQVANLKNVLVKGKNKEGDNIAAELVLIGQNRVVREGQTDEQAIAELRETANEQHRLGNVTNEATSKVMTELAKWEKEVSTEAGKKVAEDKRTLSAAIKAELPMDTGFMSSWSDEDKDRKKLVADMTRIAHARLEQAEVNRKAGKPFETSSQIWGDMRNRIDQGKIILRFPEQLRGDVEQAQKDLQEGKKILPVMAERLLLMSRQDFEQLKKSKEPNAGN